MQIIRPFFPDEIDHCPVLGIRGGADDARWFVKGDVSRRPVTENLVADSDVIERGNDAVVIDDGVAVDLDLAGRESLPRGFAAAAK